MNYTEAMSYINGFTKGGKPVKDLSRFRLLCEKLGNPQNSLKFIHVAGTNGKGSIVSYCAEILIDAGYRVGEFTSPYIYEYTERIKINGKNIPEGELAKCCESVAAAVGGCRDYSQFEISNAIAFLYFLWNGCDFVVLEAGVGGLLDSTNVVDTSVACAIASVSLDHTAVLGGTLAEIASQKAGIVKEKIPVVLSAGNTEEVRAVVRSAARTKNAPLFIVDDNLIKSEKVNIYGNVFSYKGEEYKTSLTGEYQQINAATAIEVMNVLIENGVKISIDNIRSGLMNASQPSRLERLCDSPLTIIDGAHNPAAMLTLSRFVHDLPHPIALIIGMSTDKDWQTASEIAAEFVDIAFCIDDFLPTAVRAEKLASRFRRAVISSSMMAYSEAVAEVGSEGTIIIAGSLYLGAALKTNEIKYTKRINMEEK